VFSDIKAWFTKLFKNVPAWNVIALSTLNTVAPDAELVLSFVDPAAEAIAGPIITEVQADLGTLATLLKNGSTNSLSTFIAAIKANLSSLLTAGHITNPTSVAKATGIVSAINAELDSILASVPAL
jgi:hypothetical protein